MSSAASRPARGARRSTREPSANGSTSRRSISTDPVTTQQLIAVARDHIDDVQEEEDEADPDDSTNSNSRRKNRPEINRRVPHQSFAYGAPSDGKQRRSIGGRSGSVGGRDAEASTSMTPSPHKPANELHPHADAEEEEQHPPLHPQPPQSVAPPAASRYAALKAKKQAAAAAAARSVITIETSDEELDAHGKTRKSSVPPPSPPPSQGGSGTATTARSRQGNQLNSFFMRAPAPNASQSMPSGPDDHRPTSSQQRLVMPSSLLRGAQKQPHDHIPPMLLSPRRRGAAMAANPFNESSEAGDSISRSYDYASEEAFVQRNGSASNTARDVTPPARPPGWLEKISPWRNRVSTGQPPVNGKPAAQDGEEGEDDEADASTRTARRRPRTSQGDRDQTYRPPKDFELDNDDDDMSSDGGKRPRKKSGRRSAGDHSARGGRDDNRIWKATKRRKGRKSGGTADDDDDESEEGEEDEEGDQLPNGNGDADEGAFVDGILASEQPPRRKVSKKGKSSQASSPPFGLWKPLCLGALALLIGYYRFYGSGSLEDSVIPGSSQKTNFLSSLPSFGRLVPSWTQRPAFKAPDVPPSDLQAFVDRLLSLESMVGSLSSTSSSLLTSRDKMAKQLASLEMSGQEFAKMLSKVEGREATDRDQLGGRVKALEEVGKRLRQQMDQMEVQQQRQESQNDKNFKEQRKVLDEQVKALQRDVKKNEEEIARVLTSAVTAERLAAEAKDALRPLLEMNLPAQLPVKIDPRNGKPVIEGWFYEALKGMLGGTAFEGAAPPTVSQFDWETFRSVNDASLRALIAEQASGVFSAQRTQHALLSRSDFVDLLSRELDSMKGVLEKSFNENAQGIQNDILAKVRSQQTMYEESGSWKGGSGRDVSQGKRAGARASTTSSLPLLEEVSLSQVQTKDGSDATTAVLTLIDAALEAYSADKLNRADFAAYSAGGRVVPSMTSPTFEYSLGGGGSSGGLLSWAMPWKGATSVEKFRGRSPAHALHHDNQPGMCWPFPGSYGQVGIQLARPVIVSDITIDHAPYSLLFGDKDGGGIDSAPREITVSGLVDRMEDRVRLKEWRAAQRGTEDGEMDEEEDIYPNPPANHIHLASFTYQGPGPHTRPTQTFAVSAEARALRIPVMVVQVQVHSNHGNERFTCLYRVRVHGEEVQW